MVARGFQPLEAEVLFIFCRPEGGRRSLKDFVFIEFNSMPSEQF